jgi:hypothetical protein
MADPTPPAAAPTPAAPPPRRVPDDLVAPLPTGRAEAPPSRPRAPIDRAAFDAQLERLRGWRSSRESPYPSRGAAANAAGASQTPGDADLMAVLAHHGVQGGKPAALVGPDDVGPHGREALRRIRGLPGYAVHAFDQPFDGRHVPTVLAGRVENVNAVRRLLADFGRLRHSWGDAEHADYHASLGRALGIHPEAVRDFVASEAEHRRQGPVRLYALDAAAWGPEWDEFREPPAQYAADPAAHPTRTPAFKNWFGDWEAAPHLASKVVYKNRHPETREVTGVEPLPLYHGTREEFGEFRPSGDGAAGPGIYLAANPDKASAFAGQREGGRVYKVYANIRNPLVVPFNELIKAREYADRARREGHDGLYLPAVGEWVAFHPHQVKSATGNAGTFDPADARIHYAADPAGLTAAKPRPAPKKQAAKSPTGTPQAQAEPLPPVRVLKERLAGGASLGDLAALHDWSRAKPAHYEAAEAHLQGLPDNQFFHQVHGLASAASAGHEHARRMAQAAVARRGLSDPRAARASVVDLSALEPGPQEAARGLLGAFPKLPGTEHPMAPAGFDWAGLLGEGVSSRPVTKADLPKPGAAAVPPMPRGGRHGFAAYNEHFDKMAQARLAEVADPEARASLAAHAGAHDWTGSLLHAIHAARVPEHAVDDAIQEATAKFMDPAAWRAFEKGDFGAWWKGQALDAIGKIKRGESASLGRSESSFPQAPGREDMPGVVAGARGREAMQPHEELEYQERLKMAQSSDAAMLRELRRGVERREQAEAMKEAAGVRVGRKPPSDRHWLYSPRGKAFLEEQYAGKGRPVRDIGQEVGLHPTGVLRAMAAHKIPRRTYAESQRLAEGAGRHGGEPLSDAAKWLATDGGKEYLKEQYAGKKRTLREIAVELGAGVDVVRSAMKKHGFVARPRGMAPTKVGRWFATAEGKEYLREQYAEGGRSASSIAKEKGVGAGSVVYALRKHGIEVRK